MSVWLKICGITESATLDVALCAGADAIGFVFASSPRRIALETACALSAHIDGRAQVVAVMRHPEPALAHEVLQRLAPDFLQTDIEDLAAIELPAGTRALPVIRSAGVPTQLPAQILYEGAHSGRGKLSDWHEAQSLAQRTQLVLAGGLNPENVGTAIARVQPFGVDVSSGVESRRGVKDAQRIRRFAQAVHNTPAPWQSTEDISR